MPDQSNVLFDDTGLNIMRSCLCVPEIESERERVRERGRERGRDREKERERERERDREV